MPIRLFACACLLGLAACGSGSDNASSSTAPAASPAPPAAAVEGITPRDLPVPQREVVVRNRHGRSQRHWRRQLQEKRVHLLRHRRRDPHRRIDSRRPPRSVAESGARRACRPGSRGQCLQALARSRHLQSAPVEKVQWLAGRPVSRRGIRPRSRLPCRSRSRRGTPRGTAAAAIDTAERRRVDAVADPQGPRDQASDRRSTRLSHAEATNCCRRLASAVTTWRPKSVSR